MKDKHRRMRDDDPINYMSMSVPTITWKQSIELQTAFDLLAIFMHVGKGKRSDIRQQVIDWMDKQDA